MESRGRWEEATGENPGFLMFFGKLMLIRSFIPQILIEYYHVPHSVAADTMMEKRDVVPAPLDLINKKNMN